MILQRRQKYMLSQFLRELCTICRSNLLNEKWLIAPNYRVGIQWVDQVSSAGQPVLNLRLKTIRTIAMDLSSERLTAQGLTYVSGLRKELLMDTIFEYLQSKKTGYLSRLSTGQGLLQRLRSSIDELRLAGLGSKDIRPDACEVPEKGKELVWLLEEYEKKLSANNYVDYADILILAMERINDDRESLPEGLLIIVPEAEVTLSFCPLEKQLWSRIPPSFRKILPCDNPQETVLAYRTDLALLGMIGNAAEAPSPYKDGSVNLFHATGEVNEIREIFRRIIAENIPFDTVEIIHTDSSTYVPLIYESAFLFNEENETDIPVTFEEGIPIRYSKPGRALLAWIRWMNDGLPQYILHRMIQDGLLIMPTASCPTTHQGKFAGLFRTLPIGMGRERYIPSFNHAISVCERQCSYTTTSYFEDDESPETKTQNIRERCEVLKALRSFVNELLEHTPEHHSEKGVILSCTTWFLEHAARCTNKFDNYAKEVILGKLKELEGYIKAGEILHGFDLWIWIAGLSQGLSAHALGPGPGHIYVAPLKTGGHSGRQHTFIVGLDDTRFPGSSHSDPILLDQERKRISGDLTPKSELPEKKMTELMILLSRLRGDCMLSFSSLNLHDNRQMFPSPVILSAYRILSGDHEADHGALMKALNTPKSFTPDTSDLCITASEWWALTLCGDKEIENKNELLGKFFPHLGRGFEARHARESDDFTTYDGFVPACGEDMSPYKKNGMVLSSSRLELLARCPLHFFFRYVLGIEVPEEEIPDITRWLDHMQRGCLLHAVFREFMEQLKEQNERPIVNKHQSMLHAILTKHIDMVSNEYPPFNRLAFVTDVADLKKTADVFLLREEQFCRTSVPLFFEATIGLPQTGEGTILDTEEPVSLPLYNGKTIRIRARIDRIDQTGGSGSHAFTIWDYKTGSSSRYSRSDPFSKGRVIQNILYLLAAEKRLSEQVDRDAQVKRFGYFFPRIGELGRRISWNRKTLEAGKQYISMLCDLVAGGCFPYTNKADDIIYSDYADAVIDSNETIEQVQRKTACENNENLHPFRRLRTL
jgi:ATP-dependent helicase/nuclease subunit B